MCVLLISNNFALRTRSTFWSLIRFVSLTFHKYFLSIRFSFWFPSHSVFWSKYLPNFKQEKNRNSAVKTKNLSTAVVPRDSILKTTIHYSNFQLPIDIVFDFSQCPNTRPTKKLAWPISLFQMNQITLCMVEFAIDIQLQVNPKSRKLQMTSLHNLLYWNQLCLIYSKTNRKIRSLHLHYKAKI